jgi:hypothetical protein
VRSQRLRRIAGLQAAQRNGCNEERLVILKDGSQLTPSRRYRDKVSQAL